MQIPSARDLNPFDDLDGQCAERHFLGRTVSEAVTLFVEEFSVYCADLFHMGVIAFKYYIPAAIEYADSDAAKYDCDVAGELPSLLNHRWHHEYSELGELRELFRGYCHSEIGRISNMNFEFHSDCRLERQFRRYLERLNTN